MKPIGVIHSPFKEKAETPIQFARSKAYGDVEVFAEYEEGLKSIDGFSHLYLLYIFHYALNCTDLQIKPFLDDDLHGIFATRYYCRPNPIGLSVVQLLKRDGLVLQVQGLDVLDETPLLDIKPYIPEFDICTVEKTGWYAERAYS